MTRLTRRDLLAGTALALGWEGLAQGDPGEVIQGQLPWKSASESVPQIAQPGPWHFFNAAEAAAVESLSDRLIPPDPQTPGGKDAGCAVFIDRQLAGPYGQREGEYMQGPFEKGVKQQGPQSPTTPRELYRTALAALDQHCRTLQEPGHPQGRSFSQLASTQQDDILGGLEAGTVTLAGVDGKTFFQQLLKDVQQGFFADPIYGGNRDMCSWKMIGFPGARYDYRDWVSRHNERYPYPPVSIAGRSDWTVKKS